MKLNVGLKNWQRETNILELDVPPELERTIKTGVKFFDDALGGEGITPSSSILFTGTPGAGKTTMCLQIANSITATGNICLFNTAEESLHQVRKVARRLGLNSGFVAGQDTLVSDIIAHGRFLQKNNPGKQLFLILDSLQTLDDGKYSSGAVNSMTQVRAIEQITDFCKETYASAITIGQVNKNGEFAGKQQIKHTVDVHGHLCIDMEKRSETYGERLFQVNKNRYGTSGTQFILGLNNRGLYEKGRVE